MPTTLQKLIQVQSRHEEWFFEYLRSLVEKHGQISLPSIATGSPILKTSLEKMFVCLRGDVHTRGARVQAHLDAVMVEVMSDEDVGRDIARKRDLRDSKTPIERLAEAGKISNAPLMRQNFGEVLRFVEPLDFRLVILGHPGSGKTTLAKWLTVKMTGALMEGHGRLHVPRRELFPEEANPDTSLDLGPVRVPVFLRVSEYVTYLMNLDASSFDSPRRHLTAFIWKELRNSGAARWLGIEDWNSEDDGARFLASEPWLQNRFLIILDGLDELPDTVLIQFDPAVDRRRKEIRKTVHLEIKKLAEQMRPQAGVVSSPHSQNALLITSRIRGYDFHSILPGELTHVTIESMDHAERSEFFRHWATQIMLGYDRVDQGVFATMISREVDADKRLRKEVSTPQMAGLVASIGYDNWRPVNGPGSGALLRALPQSRAEIFSRAVDLFLDHWAERELPTGIVDRDVARLLAEPGVLRSLLEQSAILIHEDPRFGSGDVDEASLGDILLKAARICKLNWRRACGNEETFKRAVVRCLTQDSGFMIERGLKVYAFQHRSIQEFLAASVLIGKTEASRSWDRLQAYLEDPRGILHWREVVILAMGQMQIRLPVDFLKLVRSVLDSEKRAKRSVPCTLLFLLELLETLPTAQDPSFLQLLVEAVLQTFAGSEDWDADAHWESFLRFLTETQKKAVTQAFLESVKKTADLAPTIAELLIRLGSTREIVHWLTPDLAEELYKARKYDSAQGNWSIHRCLAHGLSLLPDEEASKLKSRWSDTTQRHAIFEAAPCSRNGRILRRAMAEAVVPDYLSSCYLGEYRQIARYLQIESYSRKQWEDGLDETWGLDNPTYNLAVYLDSQFARHKNAETKAPTISESWAMTLRSEGRGFWERLKSAMVRRIAAGDRFSGLSLAQFESLRSRVSDTMELRLVLFADALSRGTELVFGELVQSTNRRDINIPSVICAQAVIRSFCSQGVDSFKLDALLALPEKCQGAFLAEWVAWCGHGVVSEDFVFESAKILDRLGKDISVEVLRSSLALISSAGSHTHRHPTTFMPAVLCYPASAEAYKPDDIPFHQLSQFLYYSVESRSILHPWGLQSLDRLADSNENVRAECHALRWIMADSDDTIVLAEEPVRQQHLRMWEIADSIALPYYRARYLIRMLPSANEAGQIRALERCLSDLEAMDDPHERVLVAEQLHETIMSGNVASSVALRYGPMVCHAWRGGLTNLSDPVNRSLALTRASIVLFRDRREHVLKSALNCARAIKSEDLRSEVLRQIFPLAAVFPAVRRSHMSACRRIRNKVWRDYAQGRDAAMLSILADTVSPDRPGFIACNLLATATAFQEALAFLNSDRESTVEELWRRVLSERAHAEILVERGQLDGFDLTLSRAVILDEMIRGGFGSDAGRLLPFCVNPVPQVLPLAGLWTLDSNDTVKSYGRLVRGEILKLASLTDLPFWQDLLERSHDRTRSRSQLCIHHPEEVPVVRDHRLSVVGISWVMAWGEALLVARGSCDGASNRLAWFSENLVTDAPEVIEHLAQLVEARNEAALQVLRRLEAPDEECTNMFLDKLRAATGESLALALVEALIRGLNRGKIEENLLLDLGSISPSSARVLERPFLIPTLNDYSDIWIDLASTQQPLTMNGFLERLKIDHSFQTAQLFETGAIVLAKRWAVSRLVENVDFLEKVTSHGAKQDLSIIEDFLAWYCALPIEEPLLSLQSSIRYHYLAVSAGLLNRNPGIYRGVLRLPEGLEDILNQEVQRARSWQQRAAAMEILGHLGSGSRGFVQSLAKAAKDDIISRQAVFRAVKSMREPTEEFIDAAIELLHDESGLVAFIMARVLYTISQHEAASSAQKAKICDALSIAKKDPRSRRMVYFAHFSRDPFPSHQMPRLDRHFARQLTRIWMGESSDALERSPAMGPVGRNAKFFLQSSNTPIHYVWGRNGLGEECYWFVCCSSAEYAELKRTFGTKKNVKLENFGPIVAKGMGRKPDEKTKQMLIREYRVNWSDYEDIIED